MRQSTDRVKIFPLPDTHLHGAAIMACSIIDHQEATGELKELVPILRGLVAEFKAVSRWMVEQVSDLLTRQETALLLAVSALEHPTFKTPEWFFQPERENLKAMLTRRARYLRAAKQDIDSCWDILREFCESCHHTITDDDLAAIIEAAYRGKRSA